MEIGIFSAYRNITLYNGRANLLYVAFSNRSSQSSPGESHDRQCATAVKIVRILVTAVFMEVKCAYSPVHRDIFVFPVFFSF